MRKRLLSGAAVLALTTSLPCAGAETWLLARPFAPAVNAPAAVEVREGDHFTGDVLPIVVDRTAAIQLYSKFAARDLLAPLAAGTTLPALALSFKDAGSYMMAYDTEPELIALSAEDFRAYLHEAGLDKLIERRREAGADDDPAWLRSRRTMKTLIRAGGKSDGTYAVLTGQRLEIVPSGDPFAKKPGEKQGFTLFFDSKPLEGALVRAWHRHAGQTLLVRAQTDADGKAWVTLPYAGVWMIGAAHVIPGGELADDDWESFRSSLTFELPGAMPDKRAGRAGPVPRGLPTDTQSPK